MKFLACLFLASTVLISSCASGASDSDQGKDPIVFSGKLRVIGSAMEATLILDLDTTPLLEKAHAARLGIAAEDFPLKTLAVVGTYNGELWNMQGMRISAIGSIYSIADWRSQGGANPPKLFSPNLKYCIDVQSWSKAGD